MTNSVIGLYVLNGINIFNDNTERLEVYSSHLNLYHNEGDLSLQLRPETNHGAIRKSLKHGAKSYIGNILKSLLPSKCFSESRLNTG